MKILVTGGAGYIGSHFVQAALYAGISVVVLDNLSSGRRDSVPPAVRLVQADVSNDDVVRRVLAEERPESIVHFAGLIQVGESVTQPDRYYDVNVVATIRLLDEAVRGGVGSFVFSSSAAVYGEPQVIPIPEDHPAQPINPYGATKLAAERAALDYGSAFGLRVAALRYFNAAGAHPDGHLRECHDPETHLIPLAIDAAAGDRAPLKIFGDDWPTPDGTCIRDFIHVVDLAEAHVRALETLAQGAPRLVLNLGTGRGHSVREVLAAVERATHRSVPVQMGARRPGDPPRLVASSQRAKELLAWEPRCSDIDTIVRDAARSRGVA